MPSRCASTWAVALALGVSLAGGGCAPMKPSASEEAPALREVGSVKLNPRGAKLSAWLDHLIAEVYRHWVVAARDLPEPRECVLEFTVDAEGGVSDVTTLASTGNQVLDAAAREGVTRSALLPLPLDYPRLELTIQVTFRYKAASRPPASPALEPS